MSQISQVQINYNIGENQQNAEIPIRVFIIGISQRGPVYKIVEISDVSSFLVIFGQPTNKYEFDFFQSVKSTVENGGVAICYRIPYADPDKCLYDSTFEYYITDSSKIQPIDVEYVLRDYDPLNESFSPNIYYTMKIGEKQLNEFGLYIQRTNKTTVLKYYVFRVDETEYYKLYIHDSRVYILKTVDSEDITKAIDYLPIIYQKQDGGTLSFRISVQKFNNKVSLYLEEIVENRDIGSVNGDENSDTIVYDAIYKMHKESKVEFDENLPGAKLTFTPINDFNSVLTINGNNDVELSDICRTLKNPIDPSCILGVFPLLFGPKDAENIRNVNLDGLCYYDLDENLKFEMFDCKTPMQTYVITNHNLEKNTLRQFIRASHFKYNWLEIEIANLIDKYVPQDLENAKNTIGVAFIAFYLDDEHKIDYKVLESFYGIVGASNTRFQNIEELINKNSCFFHVDMEGEVSNSYFIQALNTSTSLKYGSWLVPFIAPYSPNEDIEHNVNTIDIFSSNPIDKFSKDLSQPLSRLYDKLQNTEFINHVPFDYVLASGLQDVLLKEIPDDMQYNGTSSNGMVPYTSYIVDLDIDDESEGKETLNEIMSFQYENVRSLYRMLGMFSGLGDKGTIAFLDIPEKFNRYFKEHIDECHGNEENIKRMLAKMSIPQISRGQNATDIFPNLYGSRELYDRIYPLFNYQMVDIDKRLTRYKKFRKHRKFELVPGSTMVVGAYVSADNNDDFSPIAGPRSVESFSNCHSSFIETNPKLFKILYDLYGVTSLMNNRDNETFPVQQTTWKNSTSVLKQIHAFRIYIALRRGAYNIARSYLYEMNIEKVLGNFQNDLDYLLGRFKNRSYIDNNSSARVWSDISDIEQHQVHVEINAGIFGAIVKIIVNLNLTSMTIEVVQ